MKVAFWPGCVSKGACPELYISTQKIAPLLGLELVELTEAPCCGSGVISEQNPALADSLNAMMLAMAEREGAELMTICSVCQGTISRHNYAFANEPERLERANAVIAPEGLQYSGRTAVKHLLWILIEDIGLDTIRSLIARPLTGLRVAPFYGCQILRPEDALGIRDHPQRKTYLEQLIALVGAEPVEYHGKSKCCGFPMVTFNKKASLAMGGGHLIEAKEKGADVLVTPCPQCHLNLDAMQPEVARLLRRRIDAPILHLPQLLGLAFGFSPRELRLDRHVVSTKSALETLAPVPLKA
jgi:succinate dehydrogenase / fumarate reductase, cytochrome b subunit